MKTEIRRAPVAWDHDYRTHVAQLTRYPLSETRPTVSPVRSALFPRTPNDDIVGSMASGDVDLLDTIVLAEILTHVGATIRRGYEAVAN